MGQDVAAQHFQHRDFTRFAARLRAETGRLAALCERGELSTHGGVAGLELEAWLVHPDGRPAPANEAFLSALALPTVVHELSRFNIELNVAPQPLAGRGLERLEHELAATWRRCEAQAAGMGLGVVAIGTLPTVRDADLCPANMSNVARYRALNEQVLRQRHGHPIRLAITGAETLESEHRDVMLEAGTTSLQGHLQAAPAEAVRLYNASLIASAATVALAANAPFLFGRALWQETRIALFEQALAIGSTAAAGLSAVGRVTFGTGYAHHSLAECFAENAALFPPMLPLDLGTPDAALAHLRLHNGTIWRWNRPLVGFDDDGTPHLRIEHRVMAAGPSIADMAANLAGYYGYVRALADAPTAPESLLPFSVARENFYAAARLGLDAPVVGPDGERRPLREQVLRDVLPAAQRGLERWGVDADLAGRYLSILESRARSGRTGAQWQQRCAAACGRDMAHLTREYAARQRTGAPVHTWDS
jgi:gamma-glutamyl:cysteine ligase YbdK (ATP-grasp superfamily)